MDATAIENPAISADEQPLAFPPEPAPMQPPPFPLVACLAPLAASGLIWAITHSPFALVFAALSPVIALSGVIDGRWHSRRARRAAQRQRAHEIDTLEADLLRRQNREHARRVRLTPDARTVMQHPSRPTRWTTQSSRFATITLGRGNAGSGLRISGVAASDRERELQQRFAWIPDAPIEADARLAIGVVGSPNLVRSIARGYLIQLTHAYAPGSIEVKTLPQSEWQWARALPHFRTADDDCGLTVHIIAGPHASPSAAIEADAAVGGSGGSGGAAVIALARSPEDLPVPCRIVIVVETPGTARVLVSPEIEQLGAIVPELVSEAQAERYAAELTEHAIKTGLSAPSLDLVRSLSFAELDHELPHVTGDAHNRTLSAVIGMTQQGRLAIDLVADGPHAIVGGTTGSGKSELLVTWVTALARSYTPAQIGFLLVDFKGGSAFAPLRNLPHCVGLITDLGHGEAHRALLSLKAELRHREKVLADLGVRDIAEAAGALGRLVIVVDEFAAMLDAFPDLHALFVDIAARGRSLGVHAILCTQRPAGVVRDALMANCALRICLRVHDALDSTALVGTDAAARLSAAQPGRCIVSRDGTRTLAQIASADAHDIEAVGKHAHDSKHVNPQRRPWLDPLPAEVLLDTMLHEAASADAPSSLVSGSCVLGLEDVPEEQRHGVVTVPLAQRHLLVLGVRASGKTTTALSLASQWNRTLRVVDGHDVEALWDALEWACTLCDSTEHTEGVLLVLDDLDALVARMPDEYHDVAVQNLSRILRAGPSCGLAVVATLQRITPALRSCAALFSDTLLLKQTDRQEHVLAGGDSALYDDRSRPGAGEWRGHRIQVAVQNPSAPASTPVASFGELPKLDIGSAGSGCTVLVSRTPAARAHDLRREKTASNDAGRLVVDITAGHHETGAANELEITQGGLSTKPVVIVGDPEGWQSRWQLFASLRTRSAVVFDGCSVGDVRMLLRNRALPPLCVGGSRVWYASSPSAPLQRAQLQITAGHLAEK